jgi:hypothetical protein
MDTNPQLLFGAAPDRRSTLGQNATIKNGFRHAYDTRATVDKIGMTHRYVIKIYEFTAAFFLSLSK